MKSFGESLRERRQAKGWTLDDAASRLDCTKQYLSEVENDKTIPSLTFVKKLASLYGAKFVASVYSRSPGYLSKKIVKASTIHLACIKLLLEATEHRAESICRSLLRDKAMKKMERVTRDNKKSKTKNQ